MKKHLSVYLPLGLITAWPVIGQGFTDSFIRDGVKPKDLDRLTEKARTGRTHLSGFGSGFFITKDGYILTNCHVVEDAVEIVVLHGVTAYQANVAAKNKERDLALLKITLLPRATNGVYVIDGLPIVPFLELSDGCRVGETVYALGFPKPKVLGFEPKVTRGIVSSMTGFEGQADNFQMDASLTGGNSGGPIVNEYGSVAGVSVATAHRASISANYGINMESVFKFLPKYVKFTKGVSGRKLSADKLVAKSRDALVLVLNYGQGACERIVRTETDVADVKARESDTRFRKAMLDARMCKLKKEWKDLKDITDWILDTRGEVGDVREWNDLACEELGLHLVIVAEADGRDVMATIKPISGFKEDFAVCGKPLRLYGGREIRGFPVEARLDYEDESWVWRGELKCRYDWRGTKEIRVVMKRTGKK